MERPIHRVRGRRRSQEPPPPIVHAAPQGWGPPPPTAAAGSSGRRGGDSGSRGRAAGRRVRSARTLPLQTHTAGRVPSLAPGPAHGPANSAARTCARPVPVATAAAPLSAPPPARSRPPDAGLAPPQPADPGPGLPGAWARPPHQPALPLAAETGPTGSSPPPAPQAPRPLCGLAISNSRSTQRSLPLVHRGFNHWSTAPVHFLGEHSSSRQEAAPASLGALERRCLLEGNAELSFRPQRLEQSLLSLFALRAGPPLGSYRCS